mgnify:CR=1 FL=1
MSSLYSQLSVLKDDEDFLNEKNIQVALFLVYSNGEELPYNVLEKKMEQ